MKVVLQIRDLKDSYILSEVYCFTKFLEKCLKSGLQDISIRLLETSCANTNAAREGSDDWPLMSIKKSPFEQFLHPLERVLKDHQVPYPRREGISQKFEHFRTPLSGFTARSKRATRGDHLLQVNYARRGQEFGGGEAARGNSGDEKVGGKSFRQLNSSEATFDERRSRDRHA